VVDALGQIGTATVHEAIGRRRLRRAELRPIQQDVKIGGSAVTVLVHPGDNLMIHAAVEVCRPGDVLVVVNTAPSTHGMFGDLLAGSLMQRGVRGLVIDAGVRDTSDLRAMGFPVWSQYVSCQGTVKNTPGSVNVPVVLGGLVVNPGDVVCADDDGVVIVPREDAAWALEQSNSRIAKEAATREKLAAGELGVDFYGLRAKLAELGVEYVDRLRGSPAGCGSRARRRPSRPASRWRRTG
jgi:4-hydroxy-4-methyl-2-oxoglutarate aldolase